MPKIVGIDYENGEQTAVYVETADGVKKFVAERKRGEWIEYDCFVGNSNGEPVCKTGSVFVCSECGREERFKEPFCHCGADMREVDHAD